MWHYDPAHTHSSQLLPDVKRFLTELNASNFFSPDAPLYIARAPGRLDLMGGIADYSGSLVLEYPLEVATLVAVQSSETPFVSIVSEGDRRNVSHVNIPLDVLCPGNGPLAYEDAHRLLTANEEQAWAAYIAGVLVVLQRECQLHMHQGVKIQVHCEVPIGKGVSSSAALEVATMHALCALFDISLEGERMASLCQKVENRIVGAACGIMDQMTSACGEEGSLLHLLCQPAHLSPSIRLPDDIEVWGIDSGVRHTVSGSDYTAVRVGAFMGYRIIAERAGLTVTHFAEGYVEIDDRHWSGYLANISPSEWEIHYRDFIPQELSGEAFLEQYSGLTDSVTHVESQRRYAVRQPTAHPIYEHHRVQLFCELIQMHPLNERHLTLLGELMYQSHASYSACGLGSSGTDVLVERIKQAGPETGVYGAKITGGGCGGTVAVLARKDARDIIERIVAQYEQETGRSTTLLHGSSPGSAAWGILRLLPS